MSERRINPETGVYEENNGFIFDNWTSVQNENGNDERINPDTGVVEENTGFIFDNWTPKG
ncbi:MAG: hypothetical protein IT165_25495 [Bryobacterales bacterium]|nr:hypothetical protein [Bryobacterales bacterium]